MLKLINLIGIIFLSLNSNADVCRYYQEFINQGVPEVPLKQALFYFKNNLSVFTNTNYISVIDYSQNSMTDRFHLLHLSQGIAESYKVSHGSGLQNKTRFNFSRITKCHHGSNTKNRKNFSRAGFFKTGAEYNPRVENVISKSTQINSDSWPYVYIQGIQAKGLKLHGLSPGVNEEALASKVVFHEANFNSFSNIGRSLGCPAFIPGQGEAIMNQIYGGSLMYSYIPQCIHEHSKVLSSIPGWESMCQ